ncbi:MAG TPA: hypothetical protein VK177_08585 [Flavobacteriales bacterium]|nr:hypothetical protein [Flavobacteriales bacterium]
MKWILYIAIGILFTQCGSEKQTKSSKLNHVFEGLLEQAETATLPLVLESTKELPKSKPLREITLNKYKPYLPIVNQNFLYKKCYENDSTICLIFSQPADVELPRLYSYNKFTGVKIDSLELYVNGGIDQGYFRMNRMVLNANRTLNFYDSTWQSQTDNNGNPLAGTERITIVKKNYVVSPKGNIKLLSEQSLVR